MTSKEFVLSVYPEAKIYWYPIKSSIGTKIEYNVYNRFELTGWYDSPEKAWQHAAKIIEQKLVENLNK